MRKANENEKTLNQVFPKLQEDLIFFESGSSFEFIFRFISIIFSSGVIFAEGVSCLTSFRDIFAGFCSAKVALLPDCNMTKALPEDFCFSICAFKVWSGVSVLLILCRFNSSSSFRRFFSVFFLPGSLPWNVCDNFLKAPFSESSLPNSS
eukprot:Lithocolla_globosa_v1_NODE_6794_length_1034_cov_2.430031.p2 type:complete len:150 gc:universal NODE_6794_length_1034_cov_2.430031:643-194(-)